MTSEQDKPNVKPLALAPFLTSVGNDDAFSMLAISLSVSNLTVSGKSLIALHMAGSVNAPVHNRRIK